jgi:hypothetical protein
VSLPWRRIMTRKFPTEVQGAVRLVFVPPGTPPQLANSLRQPRSEHTMREAASDWRAREEVVSY